MCNEEKVVSVLTGSYCIRDRNDQKVIMCDSLGRIYTSVSAETKERAWYLASVLVDALPSHDIFNFLNKRN